MSVEKPAKSTLMELEAEEAINTDDDDMVTVLVGSKRTQFQHKRSILSEHSDYIKAVLTVPMAESQSGVLTFPEIEPKTWECMTGVMGDRVVARFVGIDEVLDIFPWYDKYQFLGGVEFCDAVLSDYMGALNKNLEGEKRYFVEILVLAHNNSECLPGTYKAAMGASSSWLTNIDAAVRFEEEDFSRMVEPLFLGKDALPPSVIEGFTEADIKSNVFPKYLCQFYSALKLGERKHLLTGVVIDGEAVREYCPSEGRGNEFRSRRGGGWVTSSNSSFYVHRCKTTGDWIVEKDYTEKWRNDNSFHCLIPPRTGWKCTAKDGECTFEIEYR